MQRSLILNIHLVLSSIFIPFLLIIPLSGSLYLLGVKGEVTKTKVLQFEATLPEGTKAKEEFFRNFFTANNINYSFEYIRETPNSLIFRPATKDHYTAEIKEGTVTLYKMEPSLLSRIMELHKGHGPQIMKKFEAAFGASLILILLTGLWLALTVPRYRKITLISAAIGLVALGILLI